MLLDADAAPAVVDCSVVCNGVVVWCSVVQCGVKCGYCCRAATADNIIVVVSHDDV